MYFTLYKDLYNTWGWHPNGVVNIVRCLTTKDPLLKKPYCVNEDIRNFLYIGICLG